MKSPTQFIIFVYTYLVTFLAPDLVCSVSGNQAVFFDEPGYKGNSLELSITGGCYQFKRKWRSKIVSIQVSSWTPCLMAWIDGDCGGKSVKLTPSTDYNADLREIGFDRQIRSLSLCNEISFRLINVEDRIMKPENDDTFSKGAHSDVTVHRVEINLYEEPKFAGSILTLTISGGCYTFKPKWMKRVSSIELMGHCVKLWDDSDCEGTSVTLDSLSSKQAEDLSLVDFDKRSKSVSLCSSHISSSSSDENSSGIGSFEDPFQYEGNKETGNSQTSSYENSANDDELVKVALSEHNKHRRDHGVPDLQWDSSIQKTAQSFASYLAQNNKFYHSDNDLGENLAGVSTEDKMSALKQAIQLWYNEIQNYDFNYPSHSVLGIKAGHFTQLVWKGTTHVGVGMAWNSRRSWWVIVANYSPAGNFKGLYKSNVFPPSSRN